MLSDLQHYHGEERFIIDHRVVLEHVLDREGHSAKLNKDLAGGERSHHCPDGETAHPFLLGVFPGYRSLRAIFKSLVHHHWEVPWDFEVRGHVAAVHWPLKVGQVKREGEGQALRRSWKQRLGRNSDSPWSFKVSTTHPARRIEVARANSG